MQIYNHLPHESLGGLTPQTRWSESGRKLGPIDERRLIEAFTIVEPRRVSNDHIIQFGGQDWEAPRGLDGEQVEVHRRLLEDDAPYVVHRGEMVRLSPPDLARNATSHRGKLKDSNPAPGDEDKHPAPKTASTMAFEKAFAPMTYADGGYPASPPDNQE